MTEQRMLTAAGADQPGILDELSRFILDRGGNIRDARVMNLRGHFTMLVLVEAESQQIALLTAEVAAFAERTRIDVTIGPVASASESSTKVGYLLTAHGKDQAGLVNRLSHLLRALSINMESLDTHVTPNGDREGGATFELEAHVSVPRETPVIKLREYLDHLFTESSVKWDMRASEEVG